MKKKLFLLAASMMLALGLSGCLTKKNSSASSGSSSSTSQPSSQSGSGSSSSSQSGPSSSSSSDPGPGYQDTGYTVRVNSGEALSFTTEGEEEIRPESELIGMQYQLSLSVSAGDVLTFYKEGSPITPYAGGEAPTNNVACNLNTMELTIVKSATATCYFKAYNNLTYDLWITGNEDGTGGGNFTPASSPVWAFASSENSWSTTAEPLTQDTADMPAGVKDQYSLLDHALIENEEFKITDGTEWYGFEHLETNANFEGVDSMGDKNIRTLVAGTYDIFLKILDDDSVSIYIAEDGGVLPPPADDCFLSGTFNGWTTTADPMYTLNDNSTTNPALDFEYAIEGLALAADTEFKVIYGENTYGFSIYEGKGTNAVEGTDGAFLLEQSATYSIYFKVYTNGNFGVWISSDIVVPPHGPDGSTLVDWWLVGDGSIFTSDWSTAGGIQLYSNPSNLEDKGCILSVTFAVDDLFKVTDGDTWFGYDKVQTWDDPSNAGIHCFIGEDDGFDGLNFKCTVAGTYDIYVEKSGSFWIGYAA